MPFLVYESGLSGGSNAGDEPMTATINIAASSHQQHLTLDASDLLHNITNYPDLTWVSNSSNELFGYQGGQLIVEFEISATTISANQSATITVTETLYGSLQGNNGEDAGDLGTLNVIAAPTYLGRR